MQCHTSFELKMLNYPCQLGVVIVMDPLRFAHPLLLPHHLPPIQPEILIFLYPLLPIICSKINY